MKKLLTLLFLLSFVISFAQIENKEIKNTEAKVTSISFTADSTKELQNIDWKDVKSIFKANKPEEIIKLTFGFDFKKTKNKLKGSITVSGETKNIDDLIEKSKKGIDGLIKISKNYKNN